MGLTKQQLEALNNSSFPNNNSGYITPAILRNYNSESVANTVNQDAYSVDSASVDSRLDSLEAFSSSLDANFATDAQLNASSSTLQSNINTKLDTASFNTFSQSVDSRLDNLESFSSSLDTNFASQTEFNQYTSSNDTKVNNLNVISASYLAFTQSYYSNSSSVNSRLNNSLVTASVSQSTITFTKGDGSQFNITVADVSGSTGNFVTTSSFNSYTSSNDSKWNTLGGQSGSWVTAAITASSIVTASFSSQTLTFTKGNGTQFSLSIPDVSGSTVDTGSFITTGSAANPVQRITGSLIISSSNAIDFEVSGNIRILAVGVGQALLMTSSTQDTQLTLTPTSLALSSSATQNQASYGRNSWNQSSGSVSGRTQIGMAANIAQGGNGSSTNPGIFVNYGTGVLNTAPIQFQPSQSYTDGRVTITTPLSASAGITSSDAFINGQLYSVTSASFNSRLGGFATTGSNTFNGNQTINGELIVSGGVTSSNFGYNAGILKYGYTFDPSVNADTSSRTALGKDFIKIFQYQGQNHVFGTRITSDQLNEYTGSKAFYGTTNGLLDATNLEYFSFISASTVADPTSGKINGLSLTDGRAINVVRPLLVQSLTYFDNNVNVSQSLNVTGSSTFVNDLTIQNGNFYVHGHKQFNYGAFQTNVSKSGSAGVSQSISFEITDTASGVSMVSGSRMTFANAGVYSTTFSAQIETAGGADTAWIWLKKNGTNVDESATKVTLPNNTAQTMTVNFVNDLNANDYLELCWQNNNGNAVILAENASGNIPAIPSLILTSVQVR